MSDLVLYNCRDIDAVTSAWMVRNSTVVDVDYEAQSSAYDPSSLSGYDTVYVLNFNTSKERLTKLCNKNRQVIIISNIRHNALKLWVDKPINLELHMSLYSTVIEMITPIIKARSYALSEYVLDNLKNSHNLPHSIEISAVIDHINTYTFEYLDSLQDDLLNKPKNVIVAGEAINNVVDGILKKYISRANRITIKGVEILACNCEIYQFKVVTELASRAPNGVAMVWSAYRNTCRGMVRTTYDNKISATNIINEFSHSGTNRTAKFKCSLEDITKILEVK